MGNYDKFLSNYAKAIGGKRSGEQGIKKIYEGRSYLLSFMIGNTAGRTSLWHGSRLTDSMGFASDITITTELETKADFLIFKEGFSDKISKFFGLKTEYQTGYKDFDRRYLIRVEDEPRAEGYFMIKENRDVINTIFKMGYKCVSASEFDVEISTYPSIDDPEEVLKVFPVLKRLVDSLKRF